MTGFLTTGGQLSALQGKPLLTRTSLNAKLKTENKEYKLFLVRTPEVVGSVQARERLVEVDVKSGVGTDKQ